MKNLEKCFVYFLLICSSISVILYFSSKFVEKSFGRISITQILFNVRTKGADGVASSILYEYRGCLLEYILETIFIIAVLGYVSVKITQGKGFKEITKELFGKIVKFFVIFTNKIRVLFQFKYLLVLILLFSSYYCLHTVERKFHVKEFFARTDSPFISQHYANLDVPATAQSGGNDQRNLIVIVLESMESGYRNAQIYGENLIPELTELEKEGVSLKGYRKTPGGFFTIDGVSAQLLGMPLTQLPYDIHTAANHKKYGTLLRHSAGVFNVLQTRGYETVSFAGTPGAFTHQRDFLKVHGVSSPYFAEDWKSQGYALDRNTRGRWDFNDTFVMSRMKDWLSKSHSKPFAVLFESIDTHFPVGFAPEGHRQIGDHRDSVRYSSHLVGEFIKWAKTQPWYSNTTIYIAGDHQWQDFQNDFTKLTKQDHHRGIFSLILNPARTDLHLKECGFSAMDVAPTLLEAMGLTVKSHKGEQPVEHKMGLGVSLFSTEETLVCRYGQQQFSSELMKYSDFYNKLH